MLALTAGRALVSQRVLQDSAAKREALPAMPGALRGIMAPLANLGVGYLRRKYSYDDGVEAHRQRYEQILHDLVAQNTLMQAMATAANEAETLIEVLAVAQDLLLQHVDWVRGRGYLPSEAGPDGLEQLHLDRAERDADAAQPELVAFERALAVEVTRTRGQVWDEHTHPGRPSIAFSITMKGPTLRISVQ